MFRRDFLSVLAAAPFVPVTLATNIALQEAALLSRRITLDELRVNPSGEATNFSAAKVTVLHFWSDACVPCIDELPLWRHIIEVLHERPIIKFIFLAEMPSESRLQQFLRKNAGKIPATNQYLIPYGETAANLPGSHSKLRAQLDNDIQPLTLFLDPERVVRQAFVGSIKQRLPELQEGWSRLLVAQQNHPQPFDKLQSRLPELATLVAKEKTATAGIRQAELSLLHYRFVTDTATPQLVFLTPAATAVSRDEAWLRAVKEQSSYGKIQLKISKWNNAYSCLLFLDRSQIVRQAFLGALHSFRAPEIISALERLITII